MSATAPDQMILPSLDHRDAVGDFACARHVVRDGQNARTNVARGGRDQIIDDIGGDRVETGGWFVEQQNLRVIGNCARQRDALFSCRPTARPGADRRFAHQARRARAC